MKKKKPLCFTGVNPSPDFEDFISSFISQNLSSDHQLKCFVKYFMPVQCLKNKQNKKWFEVELFTPDDIG